jgi:outer membrane immunogenic protein
VAEVVGELDGNIFYFRLGMDRSLPRSSSTLVSIVAVVGARRASIFPGSGRRPETSALRALWLASWSLKAEYLHVDLGTAGCSIPNCSAFSVVNAPFRTEIVRAGLNYRFNWGGPVMAKY